MVTVLVTMVRNESKVIARMLDSTLGACQKWFVVDTGSTDDTVEVCSAWAKKHAVDLTVQCIPFVSFGETRSRTIQKAKSWCREVWKLDLQDTWFLLLDADMILKQDAPLVTDADLVDLFQRNGVINYTNARLVRASKSIKYIGRTHEYLDIKKPCSSETRTEWWIDDRGDGGCKADKFERDERLLKQDLAEDPQSCRSLFYLAQTYACLGKTESAIKMYGLRVTSGGWDEEQWMAAYRIAELSGDMSDMVSAFGMRPWRTEPIKLIVRKLMDTDKRSAVSWCKIALSIPYPENDKLFIESSCYHEEFLSQLGVLSYYVGDQEAGMEACNRLILDRRTGHATRELAKANATWYMKPLEVLRETKLESSIDGYHACNPSICRGLTGYDLILRHVNYTIRPDGSYEYPGFVHTRNVFHRMDSKGNIIGRFELQNPPSSLTSYIRGAEDLRIQPRLISHITAIGTVIEDRPTIHQMQWNDKGELVSDERISQEGKTEKNWLPIFSPLEQGFLYSTDPFHLTDIEGETPLKIQAEDFRGGSSVISFKNGWLWIIHQVIVRPGETRRIYLHRFCWTSDLRKASDFKTSRPWCCRKPTIEFVSGLEKAYNGNLLMTYGYEDREAYLVELDPEMVWGMLR